MNKIVFQIGLLAFSLSLIYFGQRNLDYSEVLLRSFVFFVFVTLSLSVLTILFIKSINKAAARKTSELANKTNRK